jgi:S1-C subfamily serine protease
MMRRWIHLALLAGLVSPAVAQERRVEPAPGAERPKFMGEMDRVFYFNTHRGKMGITVSVVPRPATDSIGALVEAVSPGGPAFKAGIKAGDLITRFNGRTVPALARQVSPGLVLIELASNLDANDTARLEFRRGPHRRSATLVLEAMPQEQPFFPSIEGDHMALMGEPEFYTFNEGFSLVEEPGINGQARVFLRRGMADLELAPMNPGLGAYFGTTSGVLVISVPDRTLLNLRNGDVVIAVDGRKVSSPGQFFRILRSYEAGEGFRFEIMRMKRREVVTGSMANR